MLKYNTLNNPSILRWNQFALERESYEELGMLEWQNIELSIWRMWFSWNLVGCKVGLKIAELSLPRRNYAWWV